jgi:hypothetical protein
MKIMETEKLGNSKENKRIEEIVVKKLENKYGVNSVEKLQKKYNLDFYNDNGKRIVIAEIYAGIITLNSGLTIKLNSGPKRKIITDFFKLVHIENELKKDDSNKNKEYKKIVVFVDKNIENKFNRENKKDNSWVKDAVESFGIDLRTIDISEEDKEKLLNTREKQQRGNIKL